MRAFRLGNVSQSMALFDAAEQTQGPSLTPYLWQRGLSYYYADNFAATSRQFQIDVHVNPADVEEIVWDIASQLRMMDTVHQHNILISSPPSAFVTARLGRSQTNHGALGVMRE
jgi:hypothetical protein